MTLNCNHYMFFLLAARGHGRITYLLLLIRFLIILCWNERFGLTTYRSKLGGRQSPITDI